MNSRGGLGFDMVDRISLVLSQEHYNLVCLVELTVAFKYNLKCIPVCSRGGGVSGELGS